MVQDDQAQVPALLDHSFWTVYWPIFLVCHAQMSPISPFGLSYHPWPGIGSVIASHSSCEAVTVRASKLGRLEEQPEQSGNGITAASQHRRCYSRSRRG